MGPETIVPFRVSDSTSHGLSGIRIQLEETMWVLPSFSLQQAAVSLVMVFPYGLESQSWGQLESQVRDSDAAKAVLD